MDTHLGTLVTETVVGFTGAGSIARGESVWGVARYILAFVFLILWTFDISQTKLFFDVRLVVSAVVLLSSVYELIRCCLAYATIPYDPDMPPDFRLSRTWAYGVLALFPIILLDAMGVK